MREDHRSHQSPSTENRFANARSCSSSRSVDEIVVVARSNCCVRGGRHQWQTATGQFGWTIVVGFDQFRSAHVNRPVRRYVQFERQGFAYGRHAIPAD